MSIFSIILTIHIISGTLGLLSGTVGLFDHHGPKRNKILAAIFMWSMIFCGFSALALSIIHPNNFLFTVGIFTLYMIGTGERAFQKSQTINSKQTVVDWILSALMLIFGVIFIYRGVTGIIDLSSFGYVGTVFGIISLGFVLSDWRLYKDSQPINYLKAYIGRNTGAYIASLTAFLVVNNYGYVPTIIVWLGPTVLITPLIFWWINNLTTHKEST